MEIHNTCIYWHADNFYSGNMNKSDKRWTQMQIGCQFILGGIELAYIWLIKHNKNNEEIHEGRKPVMGLRNHQRTRQRRVWSSILS